MDDGEVARKFADLADQLHAQTVSWNAAQNALLVKRVNEIVQQTTGTIVKSENLQNLLRVVIEIAEKQPFLCYYEHYKVLLKNGSVSEEFLGLNTKLKNVWQECITSNGTLPTIFSEPEDDAAINSDIQLLTDKQTAMCEKILGVVSPLKREHVLALRMKAAIAHRIGMMREAGKGGSKNTEEDVQLPLYEITNLRWIGAGARAQVYSGTYHGTPVAVKVLASENPSDAETKSFAKEIQNLRALQSKSLPFIPRLVGVCTWPSAQTIITELADQNLKALLAREGDKLPWKKRISLAQEIARDIQTLHNNNILHCDLKTSSILLDNQPTKITDFWLSILQEPITTVTDPDFTPPTSLEFITGTMYGTISHMAPELLQKPAKFSVQSDIYALGMLLWDLAPKQDPYQKTLSDSLTLAKHAKEQGREVIAEDIWDAYRDLVNSCWRKNPAERISLDQIIKRLREIELLFATLFGALDVISNFDFLSTNVNATIPEGATPLFIAAQNGRADVAKILLDSKADVNLATQFGSTPLFMAARNGQLEIVTQLISRGANVNATTRTGSTPLHVAAQNGHAAIVRELTQANANVNATTQNGATPLLVAALDGRTEAVKQLLACKANVDAAMDGATPLLASAGEGNIEILQELIRHGANVNATMNDGMTALTLAASKGHTKIVNELVKNGSNLNAKMADGTTPIFIAAASGHTEIVNTLVENGADINSASSDGTTPIYMAACEGHLSVLKKLGARGANVNVPRSSGATPLIAAVSEGHVQIVRELIKLGANLDVTLKDGTTPLFMAAAAGHTDIAQELIALGANPNAASIDGTTPLFKAVEEGFTKTVTALVKAGANVNATREDGATPIFIAASEGYTATVKELLSLGASINAETTNGVTPLFAASQNGHIEVVEELIKKGAKIDAARKREESTSLSASLSNLTMMKSPVMNKVFSPQVLSPTLVTITSPQLMSPPIGSPGSPLSPGLTSSGHVKVPKKDGATPLYIAARAGSAEVVKALAQHGANINATATNGATPIFVASLKGHADVVKQLARLDADVNAKLSDGASPLFIASQMGHIDVVKQLIRRKANVNATMNDGATPLFVAAQMGHTEVVRQLVRKGARVDVARNDMTTPLQIASMRGHTATVDELKLLGAVETVSANIQTCLDNKKCTFSVTNKSYQPQPWYTCEGCSEHSKEILCCESCATTCHAGHKLSTRKFSRFFCDCGSVKYCDLKFAKDIDKIKL